MSRKERKQRQKQKANTVPPNPAAKTEKVQLRTPGFWKKNLIPAIILLILPFILYAASMQYGYVLDDKIVLSENDFVKEGFAGIGDILTKETFTGYLGEQQDLVTGGRYRPLSLVAFAVEYEIFGDNPTVFHLFNIIWYTFLGLLIFRIFGMLFPTKDKDWYLTIPFIAAILFIAHPIHTEAVANIKGRDEIMTMTLSLFTLYCCLRYIEKPKILFLVASAVMFLLALLAKENAMTFLAVIPLTIYSFTNASFKKIGIVLLPLIGAVVAYLIIRYQVIGYLLDSGKEVTALMNNPFVYMTDGEKYATIFYTLWRYIQLLFFPHPLTHDYYPYHIPIVGWSDIRSIGPLLLYSAMAVYALIKTRKRRQVPAYAILFFLATISITSNIVFSVGTFMNERFAFMPSLAFTLLIAYWLIDYLPWKLSKAKPNYMLSLGLIFVLLVGYGYKTMSRVPDWKDHMTLNISASKVSKNSARINNFMGFDYYSMAQEEKDRSQKLIYLNEAEKYLDKALQIHPTYANALMGKAGVAAGHYGLDRDLQKLLDNFYKILAVRHVPYIDTYLEYLNKRGPNPTMTNFYHHTGYTLFTVTQRNFGMATRYLNYGVQLDPNSALLNQDLCIAYYLQGRKQEAVNYGRRALHLDPTLTEARKYVDLAQGVGS